MFCFHSLAHWLWSVPLCTLCTFNTFSPTHEPPSPSLGYICSAETIWQRHKSSTDVGNAETVAPQSASQLLNRLSIPPRSGLHRSKGAVMLSSRAPEGTCPVVKAQPRGWFTVFAPEELPEIMTGFLLCRRNIKEGRNQYLAHWQKDFRPNDSPLEESDKAFQRTWLTREFSSWDLFIFQELLSFF